MKKKIILFLSVLALSVCFLAIGASAGEIYSDYTQSGANGESPIFGFLGYSVDQNAGDICVEYTVDLDALEAYEQAVGKKLNYGCVAAHKDNYNGGALIDENGKPTSNKTVVVNLNNNSSIIAIRLTGIDVSLYDEEIAICLYVCDEDGVKYISDETSTTAPALVSYDGVRGPRTVTVEGMVYSTDGVTEPAADRIKQQNASNADYNTGTTLTSKQIENPNPFNLGVLNRARLIAAGGSLINMPAASALMSHYLDNTGETYNIDVQSFLSDDSGALNSRNKAINNALRAAEALAEAGRTVTINQLAEGHPMQGDLATQNWQYAIGSYFDDVDIINLTVTEVNGVKTYTADIKYIVTDYYNWDTNDYNEFKGIVSPHDLHELHKAGKAREFLSYGEYTYLSVTWTEGQLATEISALN